MARTPFMLAYSFLLAATPLLAHHYGGTVYDLQKQVTLKGTVTKIEWQNPHIYYYLDVTDENGNVVNYQAEGGPPNALYRRGWRKDDLKAGDAVTIENASPARDGSAKISGGSTLLPNGQRVFVGEGRAAGQ